jgi:hypothetical protein
MSKAEEELAKADARANEFRRQVREHQAELDKINGSPAGEMGDRRVWLESQIRRLKIEAARAYAPVLAALEDDIKNSHQ